jgi:hypothetical protein
MPWNAGVQRPAARRASVVVLVLATTVACTDSGSSQGDGSETRSSASASAAATPETRLPPVPEQFGGWDTNLGALAFRLGWTVTTAGDASGVLDLVNERERGGPERERFEVAGSVAAPRPNGRMPVRLRMDHGIFGERRLVGYVNDRRIVLHTPNDSSLEMDLYGSTAQVDQEFRRHVRIINGPGGYEGWLRRRAFRRTIVRHVDMDGDGRPDLVTIVWSRLPAPRIGQGTRRVFVRLADGRVDDVAVPAMTITSGSRRARLGFGGIVRLPGVPGHQLVLDFAQGASHGFFDVVGYAGGGLALIPPPPLNSSWVSGGTVGTGSEDQVCLGDTLGAYQVKYPPHGRQRLTLSRYRWGGTAWLLMGELHRRVNQAELRRLLRPSGGGVWGCG